MKACLVLLLAVAANAQYFNGFYNYPYTTTYSNLGYGYNTFHYGKREAEAEPQFFGSYYGNHALTYGSYPYTTYSGYNTFHYGKREAEAEPQYFYNSGVHYPTVYSGLYNNYYNNFHYGKREAEAEPQFYGNFYSAMPYYQQTPYVYKPVTYVKPMQYKTYSNDAVKPTGYAAKGKYVAESAGAIHIAKREAEAEPTHTVGYETYQTGPASFLKKPIVAVDAFKPYTYIKSADAAYVKPTYYTTPYVHAYGKREAEAESEADPALVYSTGVQYPATTYGMTVGTPASVVYPKGYGSYGGYYNNFGYGSQYPYVRSYGKREAEAEPQFYGSYYGNRAFTYGSYPYTYTSGYNYVKPAYYY